MFEVKVFKPDEDGQLKLDRIISAAEAEEIMWERANGNQHKRKAHLRSLKRKPPTFNQHPEHLKKGT